MKSATLLFDSVTCWREPHVCCGSTASFQACVRHFRFAFDSRHIAAPHQPTKRANKRLLHCKERVHRFLFNSLTTSFVRDNID